MFPELQNIPDGSDDGTVMRCPHPLATEMPWVWHHSLLARAPAASTPCPRGVWTRSPYLSSCRMQSDCYRNETRPGPVWGCTEWRREKEGAGLSFDVTPSWLPTCRGWKQERGLVSWRSGVKLRSTRGLGQHSLPLLGSRGMMGDGAGSRGSSLTRDKSGYRLSCTPTTLSGEEEGTKLSGLSPP